MSESFIRTPHGIANYSIFYGGKDIVFCEGGSSNLNFDKVINNKFDTETLDINFWKRIFKLYSKNSNYEFRSIGSKTTVQKIAGVIVSNKITTAFAVLDKDYDNYTEDLIHSNQIKYTYGYSLEVDMCQLPTITCLCSEMSGEDKNQIMEKLGNHLDKFAPNLRRIVFYDINCVLSTDQHCFSKSSFGKLIGSISKSGSKLSAEQARIPIIEFKEEFGLKPHMTNTLSLREIKIFKDTHGKLLFELLYHAIRETLRESKMWGKNILAKHLISVTERMLSGGQLEYMDSYYKEQFSQ